MDINIKYNGKEYIIKNTTDLIYLSIYLSIYM